MSPTIYDGPNSRLPDASRYIRLLQIHPSQDGDHITCSFMVVELAKAPRYAALSYTWGEPLPLRKIYIDGEAVEIRQNCFYALSQLREQASFDAFWIDAICINQSDLAEKSLTVQMMGAIYAAASMVFVSLGPHDGQSELVFRGLRDAPKDRSEESWKAFFKEVERASGLDYLFHLRHALDGIGNREYWKRLWIVQEILAAHEVTFLCGSESRDWKYLDALDSRLNGYLIGRRSSASLELADSIEKVLGTKRWFPGRRQFDLAMLLSRFASSKCSNVMDRIYGLLYMLEQPTKCGRPLVVDYGLSKYDLLGQVAGYVQVLNTRAPSTMLDLLEALNIGPYDSVARGLISERQIDAREWHAATNSSNADPDSDSTSTTTRVNPDRGDFIDVEIWSLNVAELRVNADGSVTSSFFVNYSDEEVKLWGKLFSNAGISTDQTYEPLYLVRKHDRVGMICHGVQTGDYLARLPLDNRYLPDGNILTPCLVLRRQCNNVVHIVGQAMVHNVWLHDPNCENKHDYSIPFVLHFGFDDLIAWVAQHLFEAEEETKQYTAAVQRTKTRLSRDSNSSYVEATGVWPSTICDCPCFEHLQGYQEMHYRKEHKRWTPFQTGSIGEVK